MPGAAQPEEAALTLAFSTVAPRNAWESARGALVILDAEGRVQETPTAGMEAMRLLAVGDTLFFSDTESEYALGPGGLTRFPRGYDEISQSSVVAWQGGFAAAFNHVYGPDGRYEFGLSWGDAEATQASRISGHFGTGIRVCGGALVGIEQRLPGPSGPSPGWRTSYALQRFDVSAPTPVQELLSEFAPETDSGPPGTAVCADDTALLVTVTATNPAGEAVEERLLRFPVDGGPAHATTLRDEQGEPIRDRGTRAEHAALGSYWFVDDAGVLLRSDPASGRTTAQTETDYSIDGDAVARFDGEELVTVRLLDERRRVRVERWSLATGNRLSSATTEVAGRLPDELALFDALPLTR